MHITRSSNRGGDSASTQDVVFLDEDSVVQADTVVVTTTATHRVLLREAKTGNRLARIQQAAVGTGRCCYVDGRCRRRSRQQLQEVQRCPLGRENRARRSFQVAKQGVRLDGVSIAAMPMQFD